ncbi:hypothetical protein H696_00739 [Fonticula alba]|uniref:SURP motif domain-containing protein n=1 Tax=Fonticula alba TaxID=691883 RepID=A0A058ZGV3_FONAL|nr:hypothetical protein H696_00739 [Fonticula alba]KCV73196.1 hypothetical protein H696_00739 [Fonticula alba]|eukprot:XP_009492897.1 hypothetical protein H696_00739 [Fonticula alba]
MSAATAGQPPPPPSSAMAQPPPPPSSVAAATQPPPPPSGGGPAQPPPPGAAPSGPEGTSLPNVPEGVIIPPQEIRFVIQTSVKFIIDRGESFADTIRAKSRDQMSNKFSFFEPTDPYHKYYQWWLATERERIARGDTGPRSDATVAPTAGDAAADKPEVKSDAPPPQPPDLEFLLDTPHITALDLDIIKLTAQFVARNGRSFLLQLQQRESDNGQFDFLRNRHSLFPFFSCLVQDYSLIINPRTQLLDRLRAISEDPLRSVVEQAHARLAWRTYMAERTAAEQAQADEERRAFMAIDWNDFEVAGTIDLSPSDAVAHLSEPLTRDSLLARLASLKATQLEALASAERSSTEQDPAAGSVPAEAVAAAATSSQPAEEVTIRRDYVPLAAQGGLRREHGPQFTFRGETIAPETANDQLRVELVDPRWREQRAAAEAKQTRHASNLVQDPSQISASLQQLARQRSDIFGSEAAQRAEEDPEEQQRRLLAKERAWDGHSRSIAALREQSRAEALNPERLRREAELRQRAEEELRARQAGPKIPTTVPAPAATPAVASAAVAEVTDVPDESVDGAPDAKRPRTE